MYRLILSLAILSVLITPVQAGTLAWVVTTGVDDCPNITQTDTVKSFCVKMTDDDINRMIQGYSSRPEFGQVQATNPDGSLEFDSNGTAVMRDTTPTEIEELIISKSLTDIKANATQWLRDAAAAAAAAAVVPITSVNVSP